MRNFPRMVDLAVIAVSLITLPGCTIYQSKLGQIENLVEAVGDPDKVHVEIHREGNNPPDYWHWRCSGKLCPETNE